MSQELERHLTGRAATSIKAFYGALSRLGRETWPTALHGMGYNFEFYDALFAQMVANIQAALDDGDYTPRHQAVQFGLLPFCSEYGIEAERPLAFSHRHLYAEFFEIATGHAMPERYPQGSANPWLNASRRWAGHMRAAIMLPDASDGERARFNLGYLWAVENLSIVEFFSMRDAWNGMGIHAAYLNAHCAVEEEHNDYSVRALTAYTNASDPIVVRAIHEHEDDIAGYYEELLPLIDRAGERARRPSGAGASSEYERSSVP
jgi:hypothetical protein